MSQPAEDARTGIVILATLAVIGALYLGGEFLAPIVLAITLSALLRPIVRTLQRVRVPAPLGAGVAVFGCLAIGFAGATAFIEPLRGAVAQAPQYFSTAHEKLDRLRAPLQQVMHVAGQVQNEVKQVAGGPTTVPATAPVMVQSAGGAPELPGPLLGFGTRLFGTTAQVIGAAVEVLLLLYLILSGGGMFFRKLIHVLHGSADKRFADEAVHEAEAVVLRYMIITAFINLGQAVMVALVMWWIGMPTPMLWGVLTFVLEFIPYLGGAVVIVLLAATALATFDGIGHIVLAPASYLLISTLQNNLVSPYAYGRRLDLNPVAVLVGVMFWWYIWGIPGAFLAVPILATIKIVADRSARLKPIGEFLGPASD